MPALHRGEAQVDPSLKDVEDRQHDLGWRCLIQNESKKPREWDGIWKRSDGSAGLVLLECKLRLTTATFHKILAKMKEAKDAGIHIDQLYVAARSWASDDYETNYLSLKRTDEKNHGSLTKEDDMKLKEKASTLKESALKEPFVSILYPSGSSLKEESSKKI